MFTKKSTSSFQVILVLSKLCRSGYKNRQNLNVWMHKCIYMIFVFLSNMAFYADRILVGYWKYEKINLPLQPRL